MKVLFLSTFFIYVFSLCCANEELAKVNLWLEAENEIKDQGQLNIKDSQRKLGNYRKRGGRSSQMKRYYSRNKKVSKPSKPNSKPTSVPGMVIVRSNLPFGDTYTNLLNALNANGNINVVDKIDHSNAAASVGLELDPNSLAVFGNPALGTPIMQKNRKAGLDLPQKFLVWENAMGQVFVGYNSVDYLKFRYQGIQDAPTLETIAGALKNLASVASGVAPEDINDSGKIKLPTNGVLTKKSNADFEKTWDRLIAAIEASPATIAFTVDHSANAAGAGLELKPTRLVVFGNPKLGTPLMQVSATTGIDLPLKILVWQGDAGGVYVTTNKISFIQCRHGIRGIDEQVDAVKMAIQNFVRVATGQS